MGIPYNLNKRFKVKILHECVRNLIKAKPLPTLRYEISDPKESFSVQGWQYNMSQCAPMNYELSVYSGSKYPTFLRHSFSPEIKFSIETSAVTDFGVYEMQIKGTTIFYHLQLSSIASILKLDIICVPKKIRSI